MVNFVTVGIMETNPHKMIIRFKGKNERLLIEKRPFAEPLKKQRT